MEKSLDDAANPPSAFHRSGCARGDDQCIYVVAATPRRCDDRILSAFAEAPVDKAPSAPKLLRIYNLHLGEARFRRAGGAKPLRTSAERGESGGVDGDVKKSIRKPGRNPETIRSYRASFFSR